MKEAALQTQRSNSPAGVTPHTGLLQRKCACSGLTGNCEECKKQKLQRKPAHEDAQRSTAPPIVNSVLNAPGQPLDTETRAFMEPRFRHDFSRVRIHTDHRAMESARSVNALAYTVGPHIAFSKQFSPTQQTDLSLLAHELAHVVQQEGVSAGGNSTIEVGRTNDNSEEEADEFASSVMNGTANRGIGHVGLRVARQTPGSSTPTAPTVSAQQAMMSEADSTRLAYLSRARARLRLLQIACEKAADPLMMTQAMPEEVRPCVAWLGVLPSDKSFCAMVDWVKALVEETMGMTVPPFLFAGSNDAFCQLGNEFAYANYEGTQIRICPKTVDPARTNSTERVLILIHELFHDPRFQMDHPTVEVMNTAHCGTLGVFEAITNPYCVTNVIGSLGGGNRAVF
jgi:hypothetical protein